MPSTYRASFDAALQEPATARAVVVDPQQLTLFGLREVVLAANRAIVSVGSVGQPRDGDNRLSYVLFNGHELTFVRCEYDHPTAASRIRAVQELPDFLADRLAVGR